jgi:hypothetical protein
MIRKLQNGDLKKLPQLFSKIYEDYSLYNVRTPELYQYLLVERPKVGEEHIFVAEQGNEIIGFVAIGIKDVGQTTMISIYEIVADRREILDALLSKVEEIGRERGSALIETIASPDTDLDEYFLDSGFSKTREIVTMGYLVDSRKFLRLFIEKAISRGPFGKNVTVSFRVDEENIRMKLPEGIIDSSEQADIRITVAPSDFQSLLLKRSSFLSLVITRKVAVKPLQKIIAASEVVDYIAEDVKMMTPFTELT